MLICLGGVCIPYTAVVPLVILTLQWIISKLGLIRFLPTFLQKALQLDSRIASSSSEKNCCDTFSSNGPSIVQALESDQELEDLLQDPTKKVVCKFTSTWCQPCKRIQPFFEQLSSAYNNLTTIDFRTIDVDDFEDIATKYKVTMMPTFLVLEGEQILGTYKGSNEPELKKFLEEHASPSMTN